LTYLLPIGAAVFVVMATFSQHSNRLPWSQLGTALIMAVMVGVVCLGPFILVPSMRRVAAFPATVLVLMTTLWMAFPHKLIPTAIVLLAIMVTVKGKGIPQLINVLSVLCVAAILVSTAGAVWTSQTAADDHPPEQTMVLQRTPDIYFIVPDRFCNHIGLLDSGYDNSEFLEYLESEGFYVDWEKLSEDELLPESKAPATTRTIRFLASVLNLGVDVPLNVPYNRASNMVKHHAVGEILQSNGYTYHHIGDWWAETETNTMADAVYVHRESSLMPSDELSMALIDRSVYRYLASYLWRGHDAYRNRNLYQLEAFKEAAVAPSPKFVFVHTLVPHPPYVWAADGSPQTDATLTTEERYIEQVKWTETFLKQFIAEVDKDAILIIQSDEGIAYTARGANYGLTNHQWNGVLAAWRIPGADPSELDDVKITEILAYVLDSLA
jgi:hypothetical protein